MTPDDARPGADEVGHDPDACTACQHYRREAERLGQLLDRTELHGILPNAPRQSVGLSPQTRAILQRALDGRDR